MLPMFRRTAMGAMSNKVFQAMFDDFVKFVDFGAIGATSAAIGA